MLLSTSTSRWSALTTLVMLTSCVTSLDAKPSPQSTTPVLLAMNLSKSPKVIRAVHENQDMTASILSRKLDVVTPKKRQDDQLPIRRHTTASSSLAKKSDERNKRSLPQRGTMKGRENRKNKRAGFNSSHIKTQLALKAKFKREKVEQVEKASKDKINEAKTTTASGDSKPRASETKKSDSKASATKKADGTAKSKSRSATTKAGATGAAGAAGATGAAGAAGATGAAGAAGAAATTTAPVAAAAAPAMTTTPAAADAAAASVMTMNADLTTSAAAAATTPTDATSSAGRGAHSLMSVGSMTGLVAVVLTILS